MSEDIDIHDEIEAYLKGKLKGRELGQFNEKLKDSEFREKVELQKVANNIVITKQLSVLKEQMQADLANTNKGNGNFFRKIWPAVLLVSFVATTYLYLKDKKTDSSNNSSNSTTIISEKSTPASVEEESHLPFITKKEVPQENNSNGKTISIKSDSIVTPIEKKEVRVSSDNSNHQNIVTPPVITKDSIKTTIAQQENIICNLKLSDDLFTISTACVGKADGSISIDPEKNLEGKAPFKFSINNSGTTKSGIFKSGSRVIYYYSKRCQTMCGRTCH